MPPRLPKRQRQNQKNKNAGTLIALGGMFFLAAGLFGLAVMVLGPGALAVVGLAALLGLFVAFHYVVWGKWLSTRLPVSDADDD